MTSKGSSNLVIGSLWVVVAFVLVAIAISIVVLYFINNSGILAGGAMPQIGEGILT